MTLGYSDCAAIDNRAAGVGDNPEPAVAKARAFDAILRSDRFLSSDAMMIRPTDCRLGERVVS